MPSVSIKLAAPTSTRKISVSTEVTYTQLCDHVSQLFGFDLASVSISWIDTDGDVIVCSSDEELAEALDEMQTSGRAVKFTVNGKQPVPVAITEPESVATSSDTIDTPVYEALPPDSQPPPEEPPKEGCKFHWLQFVLHMRQFRASLRNIEVPEETRAEFRTAMHHLREFFKCVHDHADFFLQTYALTAARKISDLDYTAIPWERIFFTILMFFFLPFHAMFVLIGMFMLLPTGDSNDVRSRIFNAGKKGIAVVIILFFLPLPVLAKIVLVYTIVKVIIKRKMRRGRWWRGCGNNNGGNAAGERQCGRRNNFCSQCEHCKKE